MSEPLAIGMPSDRHLLALGRLCVAWAVMDRKLTDVASVLIGRGPIVTAAIFPGAENMTPRSEAIKKLIVVEAPGDVEWQKQLTSLVKDVAGRLARRRNRLTHDEWFQTENELVRIQWAARIDAQEDGSSRLNAGQRTNENPDEVEGFVKEIERAAYQLSLAAITLSRWRREGQPPEPFWL